MQNKIIECQECGEKIINTEKHTYQRCLEIRNKLKLKANQKILEEFKSLKEEWLKVIKDSKEILSTVGNISGSMRDIASKFKYIEDKIFDLESKINEGGDKVVSTSMNLSNNEKIVGEEDIEQLDDLLLFSYQNR